MTQGAFQIVECARRASKSGRIGDDEYAGSFRSIAWRGESRISRARRVHLCDRRRSSHWLADRRLVAYGPALSDRFPLFGASGRNAEHLSDGTRAEKARGLKQERKN
jgi:hypothetical protein